MGDSLWDLSETDADEQRVLSQKEREFLMPVIRAHTRMRRWYVVSLKK